MSSSRCGTPANVRSASAIASSSIPAARAAAVAAAAFSRLWSPGMRGSAGSASSAANSTRRADARNLAEPARDDGDVVRALVLEDAELRGAVGLEVAVAVEVVGRQVEEDGDLGPERLDVLELEARELAHDPRVFGDCAVEAGERTADVPGHGDGPAGGSKDGAEQLARRRFPVRPGHPDDGVREQARAELHLAPDGEAARACGGREGCLARDSGALHQQVHAVKERGVHRAEDDFDARLAKPPHVEALVPVHADDPDTPARERDRRGLARAREAEHERRLRKRTQRRSGNRGRSRRRTGSR